MVTHKKENTLVSMVSLLASWSGKTWKNDRAAGSVLPMFVDLQGSKPISSQCLPHDEMKFVLNTVWRDNDQLLLT